MTLVLPAAVPVEGTRRIVFVEGGVADKTAVTLAEAEAGDNISCYVTGNGWAPTRDQQVITDARLCTSQDLQIPGRKTAGLVLTYTSNLDTAGDDEARLALTEGATGDFIHILQKPEEDEDFEAGDWYEVWSGRLGQQVFLPPETNAIDRIQQTVFVSGVVTDVFQLVAGS